MKDVTVSILAAGMGLGGALVELNLVRVFVREWIQNRDDVASKRPFRIERVRRRSPHRFTLCLAVAMVGPLFSAPFARGQEKRDGAGPDTTLQVGQSITPIAAESKKPFSLQVNLDWTSAYFYHGINQEDTGFIMQPAAKLTWTLLEQDDVKIDGILGTWNSFHGRKTGATVGGDFVSYWYESDLIGGVALTKGKVSLTATYTALTSPSDAYKTVQELDFTLAYDDSDLLGKFALHPYAMLGWEVGANGSDGGDSDPGQYLEFGIAPGFTWDVGRTPVAVSFPVMAGLSLHDYYQNAAGEDATFGFACVGVKGSIPLDIAERYGKWTLNAGVMLMFYGDHTSDLNAGRREQVVGTIGLQLNY